MVPKIDPTVAAVVVVFDPDDRFKQLLLSLVEQVNKIWIIDNQPNSVSCNYIKGGQFQQRNNIKLVENKKKRRPCCRSKPGNKSSSRRWSGLDSTTRPGQYT